MIDWKQKLKNQWVQIEISRVQPGKPGNFLPLGPFPFQYSSDTPLGLFCHAPNLVVRSMKPQNKLCIKLEV